MYRNRLWMVLWLLVFTFIIPYPGYSQGIPKLNKEAHRWVMGTINSVGGVLFYQNQGGNDTQLQHKRVGEGKDPESPGR